MTGCLISKLLEKLELQLLYSLLGVEDFLLVLLQFLGYEPLRVDERLFPDIVFRDAREIRPGDLDVLAEDRVVIHFERRNTCPLALSHLHPRDPILGIVRESAELIEICIISFPYDPAFRRLYREVVCQGLS